MDSCPLSLARPVPSLISSPDVSAFLRRFHQSDNVTDVFSFGCCYWFAKILFDRFSHLSGTEIMYDEIENHFGTKVGESVYDITGDVTAKYVWKPWADLNDDLLRKRIIRDCIMF